MLGVMKPWVRLMVEGGREGKGERKGGEWERERGRRSGEGRGERRRVGEGERKEESEEKRGRRGEGEKGRRGDSWMSTQRTVERNYSTQVKASNS